MLINFCSDYKVLSDNQFGCKKIGVLKLIASISNFIYNLINSLYTLETMLDLVKAFDPVNHNKLQAIQVKSINVV